MEGNFCLTGRPARPVALLRRAAAAFLLAACALPVAAQEGGMPAEAQAFLRSLPAGLQQAQEAAVRRATAGDTAALVAVRHSRNARPELPPGVTARDIAPCYRLYRPAAAGDTVALPVLVYLHGGGWCFGSINSCARFCAELSRTAGVAVLAVDYPLAPEHPWPAALTACTAAVAFAREHAAEYGFLPGRISIGGDSSGGNLALATALHLVSACRIADGQNAPQAPSDTLPPIRSLVLFYPVTKAWADGSPSWQRYGAGYGLDAGLMEAFNAAYAGANDVRLPLISPVAAPDELLRRLPPTLIVSAECDILLSQGTELARRLESLSVAVSHSVLPGTVHLFITVPGQAAAFGAAVRRAADFLK